MREKIGDTIKMLDGAIKLIEEIREEAKSNTFLNEGMRLFLTPQIEMLFSNVRVARQQLQYISDFVPETKETKRG